jgi:hypothetical protein
MKSTTVELGDVHINFQETDKLSNQQAQYSLSQSASVSMIPCHLNPNHDDTTSFPKSIIVLLVILYLQSDLFPRGFATKTFSMNFLFICILLDFSLQRILGDLCK